MSYKQWERENRQPIVFKTFYILSLEYAQEHNKLLLSIENLI